MERHDPPDVVQREIDWRFQGGTPHDVEITRGVAWAHQFYPHAPLVAIVNRHEPTYAAYFHSRDDVEQFIRQLRKAMARAWPDPASREP